MRERLCEFVIFWYSSDLYERVAVGRKYPCTRRPWICLLWYLLQRLFHVQIGSNLNLGQSLYVQPLWLWLDDNLLAWSGAIHLYKKAIVLAVNTAILHGKSGISRVLTSNYKVMTECLILVAWSHRMVKWYQMQLHTLKKAL